jgi:hypothetical protein
MEELFLDAFLAFDELDVIDQQDVDISVAAFEGDFAVVTQRVDEIVGEFLGGDVLDPHPGKQPLGVVAGGMQQVSLAQTGFAPDEEWVVGPCRRFGDGQGRGVGETVRRTDDEGVEGVSPVEARCRRFRCGAGLGPVDEITRPVLIGAGAGKGIGVVVQYLVVRVGERDIVVGGFVGVKIRGRFDPNAEFHPLAETSTQCIHDRDPEVAFDLVLDERTRNRKQGKAFSDREWPYELEPRALLGCQGRVQDLAVITGGRVDLAVEFGDDGLPHRGEVGTGAVGQRGSPCVKLELRLTDPSLNCPHIYPQMCTALETSLKRSIWALVLMSGREPANDCRCPRSARS